MDCLNSGAKFRNVDLNTSSLKMYWNIVKQFGGQVWNTMDNLAPTCLNNSRNTAYSLQKLQEVWRELLLVLSKIAQKHSVSTANVSLR
jgi:hypothetical protein